MFLDQLVPCDEDVNATCPVLSWGMAQQCPMNGTNRTLCNPMDSRCYSVDATSADIVRVRRVCMRVHVHVSACLYVYVQVSLCVMPLPPPTPPSSLLCRHKLVLVDLVGSRVA